MGASCATASKTPGVRPSDPAQAGRAETAGPQEAYGPPAPEQTPSYGPERLAVRPIILVLGPGLARGFGHVGVIRGLHENKIPIGAILGVEMGSLIGALYAVKGNLNSLEWALFKLKDEAFLERRGFLKHFLSKPGDGEKLAKELERVFGKKDLSEAKIPLRISIQSTDVSGSKVLDKGLIRAAVRASLAVPGLFAPVAWEGREAFAPIATHPFPVAEARLLGLGPIVVVDVLDGDSADTGASRPIEQQMAKAFAAAAAELKDADLVIRADMKGIGFLDFQKRSEAAFRGKTAVTAQIAAIRQLAGLPEGGAQP